ncbi:MAG: NAD(+)/NADH kinase [Bacillota bacterium]
MRFGIIPNLSKDSDLTITENIVKWLKNKNVEVMLNDTIANKLYMPELAFPVEEIYSDSDMVIVLGGDGTLLNVARQSCIYDVPLFGINLGHLGFLTETEVADMYHVFERILEGEYRIEKRMMLDAYVEKDNILLGRFTALNDIGITRGTFSRIISCSLFINDSFVDLYAADGLIICSPTGSTAYSLSAGGPLVSPLVKVLIITPICPHSLHSRSIVVSDEDIVKVEICENSTEVMLTVDGQHGYKLKPGDIVTVSKSGYQTSLVKLNQRSFFDVLRRKMSERMNYKNS